MRTPPFAVSVLWQSSSKLKDHTEDGLMAAVPRAPKVIANEPRARIVPTDPPVEILRQAQNEVVGPQIIERNPVVRAGRKRIKGKDKQRLPEPSRSVARGRRQGHDHRIL